jgi:hypothetical protein
MDGCHLKWQRPLCDEPTYLNRKHEILKRP